MRWREGGRKLLKVYLLYKEKWERKPWEDLYSSHSNNQAGNCSKNKHIKWMYFIFHNFYTSFYEALKVCIMNS